MFDIHFNVSLNVLKSLICMPQIFAHWVWLAKETDTAANRKHGLVPMRSHSRKLMGHCKCKNQHQYFNLFLSFLGRIS